MLQRVGGPLALLLGVLAAVRAGGLPAPGAESAVDGWSALTLSRPGLLLREADAALAAGDVARAEQGYVALTQRHPIIADYAELALLTLLAQSGRAEEALARGEAWPYEDSPLRSDVYREVGDTRAAQGNEEMARIAYERALEATGDSRRRAQLLLAKGESLRRSRLEEPAAKALMEVWVRYPLAEAPGLEAALDELGAALGRSLRNADHTRKRADVLFGARHNEAALAAYERAIALGLDPSGARRARRQRAHTLFRMRRYTEAADAFAALPRTGENRTAQARARARAGDAVGAAEELEVIAREVGGAEGTYAKLVAALLWDGEDQPKRAQKLFASLASSGGPRARSALWWLGWDAYRSGRHEEALEHLGQLVEREHNLDARLRARYWRARAAQHAGRSDAEAQFAAIAREFPLTYYGWRAGARVPPQTGVIEPPGVEPGAPSVEPRELERPRMLLEAGRVPAAREELERIYGRTGGLSDRLALADLYANVGDFHRAQRIVMDAYAETLARGPVTASIELWWHAWPAPFREIVDRETDPRPGLEPGLVYAIMREESGYRPDVRSVAGAFGLMQLMPDTAVRVAERDALVGFRVDDLFLPHVNIRLGAAYLHELLDSFDGRASAAIGSYNAGPERITRWLENGPAEDDEWVEAIPFEQTRNYVKRVLRSMHVYQVLH
ncbi:MAG: lytic transglycosylase domain-containing protein [Deltaproteobacteria bacterium]|nr:lytic transglycosylase domain-containing protein [Deltaproteobacteria bacterium]